MDKNSWLIRFARWTPRWMIYVVMALAVLATIGIWVMMFVSMSDGWGLLFEKKQKVMFISSARRKGTKEASTYPKPFPIWKGCSWLRAETALRQGFGKVYKAFALRVNLSILDVKLGHAITNERANITTLWMKLRRRNLFTHRQKVKNELQIS